MSTSGEHDLADASEGAAPGTDPTPVHGGSARPVRTAGEAGGIPGGALTGATTTVGGLVSHALALAHTLVSNVRDVEEPTASRLLAAVNDLEREVRGLRDAAPAPRGSPSPRRGTGAGGDAPAFLDVSSLVDALERTASRLELLAAAAARVTDALDLLEAADRTSLAAHTLGATRPVLDAPGAARTVAPPRGDPGRPDTRAIPDTGARGDARAHRDPAARVRARHGRRAPGGASVRLVGTRRGLPFEVDILCDGQTVGERARRTGEAPRPRDRVGTASGERSGDGWRPIPAASQEAGRGAGDPARRADAPHAHDRLEQVVRHHDRVISALYAIGLAAESLYKREPDSELQERLGDIIDWLGTAISDLRAATFDLVQGCSGGTRPADGSSWSGAEPSVENEADTPPGDPGTLPAR